MTPMSEAIIIGSPCSSANPAPESVKRASPIASINTACSCHRLTRTLNVRLYTKATHSTPMTQM